MFMSTAFYIVVLFLYQIFIGHNDNDDDDD